VLLTTQYLDEAEQLADRIAILHEGRIIENGSSEALPGVTQPPSHLRSGARPGLDTDS
jgi:ABC-2 type transport system ATP-binding protein